MANNLALLICYIYSLLNMISQAKIIVCISDFGLSVADKICWENHNDFKFTAVIEYSLLYQFYEFENSVSSLTDFINHWITKIGGANYAGFYSGGYKYSLIKQSHIQVTIMSTWVLLCIFLLILE